MLKSKKVLLIGMDPNLFDFSLAPHLDASKVFAAIDACVKKLVALEYNPEFCLIDLGETAESVIIGHLSAKEYDCIVIGAGVKISSHLLFESVVNWVHRYAPNSYICFTTNPSDAVEAIQRWI